MSQNPTVLILAAGENSRFFPFNADRHKASTELHGEPIIIRTLRSLQNHHFKDVVIVVSEKDFGGKGLSGRIHTIELDLKVSFVLLPEATGMGSAVLSATDKLTERFFVINPYYINAGGLLEQLLNDSHQNVLAATETDRPWDYGIFQLEGEKVVGIVEKPAQGTEPSNLKNEVLHLLNQEFLNTLKELPSEHYSYEKALDLLIKKTDVGIVKLTKALPTLKYPWHLFYFHQDLLSTVPSKIAHDAQVAPTAVIDDSKGPVIIESGAKIGHAAKIVGPCYIGRHVFVGDFSLIRGSSLEEDVVVGSYTEVVRSILSSRSDIHYGYIADSIVGSDVKIGAGLITANKRHDREHLKVNVKGQKVDTGRNGLGVCIGDRAKIGVRTTIMPGLMIGADSVIFPSQTLYENVEHGAVVKTILPHE